MENSQFKRGCTTVCAVCEDNNNYSFGSLEDLYGRLEGCIHTAEISKPKTGAATFGIVVSQVSHPTLGK
jgi:hypothetical protein